MNLRILKLTSCNSYNLSDAMPGFDVAMSTMGYAYANPSHWLKNQNLKLKKYKHSKFYCYATSIVSSKQSNVEVFC